MWNVSILLSCFFQNNRELRSVCRVTPLFSVYLLFIGRSGKGKNFCVARIRQQMSLNDVKKRRAECQPWSNVLREDGAIFQPKYSRIVFITDWPTVPIINNAAAIYSTMLVLSADLQNWNEYLISAFAVIIARGIISRPHGRPIDFYFFLNGKQLKLCFKKFSL